MKEEYVIYEQAIKLKELGFKDKCNAYYWTEDKAFECTNSIVHKNSDTCQTVVMAPSLWQAQKWLRDKWRIHVEPNFIYETKFEVVIKRQKGSIFKRAERQFDSYEEALSFGIDAALELLTDNKNDK